jgi:hypothetical protein
MQASPTLLSATRFSALDLFCPTAGISLCTDECNMPGSQSLHFNSLFAKLQIVSNKFPHSKAHGAPPNVRQNMMIASPSSGSCVAVWKAILKQSVPYW